MATHTDKDVICKEHAAIKARRKFHKRAEGDPAQDSVGLALSGGGVRSATFNLGLLQALDKHNILDRVDYLSTVSGGGYIGTALTRYLNTWPNGNAPTTSKPPFPFDRENPNKIVDHIRSHASYLTPGCGLNRFALSAAILRGISINLFILGPIFLLLMWALTFRCNWVEWHWIQQHCTGNRIPLVFAGVIIITAIVWGVLFRILSQHYPHDGRTRYSSLWETISLILPALIMITVMWRGKIGILFALTGTIVLIILTFITLLNLKEQYPFNWWWELFSRVIVASILFSLWTWRGELILASWAHHPKMFLVFLSVGTGLLIKLVLGNILFAILSSWKDRLSSEGAIFFSAEYGYLLSWGLFFCALGSLPLLHGLITPLSDHIQISEITIPAATGTLGILSTAIGWIIRNRKGEFSGFVTFFLRLGLLLLVLAIAIGLYAAATSIGSEVIKDVTWWKLALAALAAFIFALLLNADFNFVSVHQYYSDRLLDAYIRAPKPAAKQGENESEFKIKDICIEKSGAPYPIINCTVLTPHSREAKYRLRRGDNFIFSPRYIGANSTGYAQNDKDYKLSTAMAVSGAAIDPYTGEATTWELRFLMTLLNIRLGYWILNPDLFSSSTNSTESNYWTRFRKYVQASWVWLVGREMFCGLSEKSPRVRLSDGGHFENLGLYELVRRKCRLIIVSDAGEDGHWKFEDLARAIERVRVDFGAEIEIDLSPVKPYPTDGFSYQPFTIGSILYQNEDRTKSRDKTHGIIIYFKATLFGNLPADIVGYRSANPAFPNESSLNQFFTELQFEAYRELGYQSGRRLFDSQTWRDVFRRMALS